MEIINYEDKANEINMDDIVFHGTNIENYNSLSINWHILNGCNYKCSYCFGQDSLLEKDFQPIESMKSAVDKIFEIDKEYYTFNLVGGEVTYHPHFLDLIEYICSFNKKIYILLISNASKPVNYFEKLLQITSNINFKLMFSVHFEYANIEHIEELIILFNKYQKKISIKLMLHPEYQEKIKQYYNILIELKKKYNFSIYLAELREPPDFNKVDRRYDKDFFEWIDNNRDNIANMKSEENYTYNYNEEVYKVYYKLNNEHNISISHDLALRNNLKQFKNFYCTGGVSLIYILPNGEYRGGICELLPNIGNIYKDEHINLYKLTKPIKCTIDQCGCDANDVINKYKDKNEADKYISNYTDKHLKLMFNGLSNEYEKLYKEKSKIEKFINNLAWWIPIKKWRDNFRNKFNIRPDQ